MQANAQAVAEKLLQIKAIQLNPSNPFTWASGWKSPIYCDNRKVLSFPYERDFIKSELCNVLFSEYENADAIAGVATAGIAWGAMAADQLKLPFLYVRPKPKEHGLGNQIEGNVFPGKKVVVIEDLISTGKSSLAVVKVLQQAGMEVIGLVSLFTYGFDVADQLFKEAGIPFKTLTNYSVLINLAVQKQIVDASTEELLLNWCNAPDKWGQNK
ncbi:orotate phosphoribosyltransferase [Hydrotalea sp.]|uniref:orotate phosphoribosyltransferase n=1 Tax=Hydrotalea sp. TaxID=2881279 RepID=UPI003D0F7568